MLWLLLLGSLGEGRECAVWSNDLMGLMGLMDFVVDDDLMMNDTPLHLITPAPRPRSSVFRVTSL